MAGDEGRVARALVAALVAALLVPASAFGADAGPWHARPATYDVSAAEQHMVTMSDGVALAVDVYRPVDRATGKPAAGRFPVMLSQTPYGKRSTVTTQSMGSGFGGDGYYPYLISRGYIDVVADVRGTGSSDGDFSLFGPREMRDGVELADWAAKLPGSTGRVGLAGSSYLGLNQIFTAALAGPGSPVRAIFPSTTGNDLYRDLSFGGGIPNLVFGATFQALRGTMVTAVPDEPGQDPSALVEHPADRAVGEGELDASLYAEIDTGGPRAFDTDFWIRRAPRLYLDRVVRNGVPAMLLSGWHDVYQRGAALDYAGFQNAWSRLHGGPGRPAAEAPPMTAAQRPTGRYQLVSGPWFHNPATLGERFQQIQLAWFDRWLRGLPTGIDRTTRPLHAFEIGSGRWIDAARYPLDEARATTFHLDAGGGLSGQRPRAVGSDQIAWSDFRGPCNPAADQWSTGLFTYFEAMAGLPGNPCARDDRPQPGALTYTTAPFRRATTIAGPIDASLRLTSTTPDAELVGTVEQVAPDGTSRPLSTGALLGSLRAVDRRLSWSRDGATILPAHPYTAASARDLRPGAVETLDVEIYPTVARLAPGDRLRLTVTTGDTALQPSPVQAARLAGGVYAVQRGGAHGSTLTVPMAPAGAFRTSPIDWGECKASC